MKRLLAGIVLLALALPAHGAAGADAILGRWRTAPTEHGVAHVQIEANGGSYRGRIVWLSEPDFPPGDEMAGAPKVDRLNPDAELRGRPILGLQIVDGFRYSGSGHWSGGRIYDPESGRTYRCKIRLTEDGALRVRGYVGLSVLGRTTVWVRAPED